MRLLICGVSQIHVEEKNVSSLHVINSYKPKSIFRFRKVDQILRPLKKPQTKNKTS